jgi:hypothetical protein
VGITSRFLFDAGLLTPVSISFGAGLLTPPTTGPKVSDRARGLETFGRPGGKVERPCHNGSTGRVWREATPQVSKPPDCALRGASSPTKLGK